jgi:hypothetical protein
LADDLGQGKIIQLRALLASKHPQPAARPALARWPTGIRSFDACLEGGLPKGALTEIICPSLGSGSATLIQALVAARQNAGEHFALVDASDSFDVDGLTNEQLSGLLWVRCQGPEQAIKAADLLCRDNNLPLLVLDFALCSEQQVRAIPSTYWYRLQRVAEGNGSTTLIFTPVSVVGSAACTLRLGGWFTLSALDRLRDQLLAELQMKAVRTRTFQRSEPEALALSRMAG